MKATLPLPPSSNRYWRVWRGRAVVSTEARAYKLNARLRALSQGMRPVSGPVVLNLVVYRARKAGDLSNRIKVAEDALQGVAYTNDSQVVELHARLEDDPGNPRLVVWVESVERRDDNSTRGWARG